LKSNLDNKELHDFMLLTKATGFHCNHHRDGHTLVREWKTLPIILLSLGERRGVRNIGRVNMEYDNEGEMTMEVGGWDEMCL
jgi:hypothetical protein